jgi:hypothetical protein
VTGLERRLAGLVDKGDYNQDYPASHEADTEHLQRGDKITDELGQPPLYLGGQAELS